MNTGGDPVKIAAGGTGNSFSPAPSDRGQPGEFEPGRSTEDKISAVQYLRFPLTADDHRALATEGTRVAIVIDHPAYRHTAEGGEPLRASLAAHGRANGDARAEG